jgi:hypothetical protein
VSVSKLHLTFVASNFFPETNTINSGVNFVHQLGGSTLVTVGALPVEVSDAVVCAEEMGPINALTTNNNAMNARRSFL